jgi:hypothetical protein
MSNDRNEILEEVASRIDNTANALHVMSYRNALHKLEINAAAKAVEQLAKDVRAMKTRALTVIDIAE